MPKSKNLRVFLPQAAEALGLKEETLSTYVRQGKVKGKKNQKGTWFSRGTLRAFANQRGEPIPHPEILRDEQHPDWDVGKKVARKLSERFTAHAGEMNEIGESHAAPKPESKSRRHRVAIQRGQDAIIVGSEEPATELPSF